MAVPLLALASFTGVLLSGWLSDRFERRKFERRKPLVIAPVHRERDAAGAQRRAGDPDQARATSRVGRAGEEVLINTIDIALPSGGGRVRGRRESGVARFLGIPYAAAPVGPLRFAAPAPPPRWEGVRDATAPGPWAPQLPEPKESVLPRTVVSGDDYLNLNVWTRDVDGRAPVMVFIHGGSLVIGSGALPVSDGTAFARDGVVLVTINYRLGADGFLWTGEGVPNRGLLDQIAALEWVRENIAAFGGDAANVTIFGESAGAMSVMALATMPRAAGLFRRVIAESGAGEHVTDEATALLAAKRLARRLGVAPTLAGVAAVPMPDLLAAVGALTVDVTSRPFAHRWKDAARLLLPFAPFADGDVVPGLPRDLILAGAAHDVDLMIGTTTDEARLFFVPTGAIDRLPRVFPWLFATRYGGRATRVRASYRRRRGLCSSGDLAAAVLTDGFFRVPALRLAAAHPRAFVYEFAWRSPEFGGRLGACHGVELPFVFDTLGKSGLEGITGDAPPQALATEVHAAWVAFAT
ncbi:MAG: carboxylesterase family protein, partial [Propionibacteriaceae bacterium]|nr:carboxylesterase family protein [Propionibacteriaceae bacterium]